MTSLLATAVVVPLLGCGRVAFDERIALDATDAPDTLQATASAIAAGDDHSCAIVDGALSCFGAGPQGQIGNGGTAPMYPSPQPVPGAWRAVTTGRTHTCAIDLDSAVWCWGSNAIGQLGVAGGNRSTPVQVALAPTPAPIHIETTYEHTCVLRDDTSITCWGRNLEGELGLDDDGSIGMYAMPTTPTINLGFTALSAAHAMTIGVRGGQAYGTGRNVTNQLGLGPGAPGLFRKFVAGPVGPWLTVAGGQNQSVGIATDGSLWGWGANDMYQLGTGDTVSTNTAVPIDNTRAWRDVDIDTFHGCGIVDSGQLYCWGRTTEGQLGVDNLSVPWIVPTRSSMFDDVVEIAVGRFHTCLQRSDKTVWCTGDGEFGRLGTGNTTRLYAWTQITL